MLYRTELRITGGGIEAILKITFSYFSLKTNIVTLHLNSLDQMVLIVGHNIHFKVVLWKIIPKLSLLPLLIWSTVEVV